MRFSVYLDSARGWKGKAVCMVASEYARSRSPTTSSAAAAVPCLLTNTNNPRSHWETLEYHNIIRRAVHRRTRKHDCTGVYSAAIWRLHYHRHHHQLTNLRELCIRVVHVVFCLVRKWCCLLLKPNTLYIAAKLCCAWCTMRNVQSWISSLSEIAFARIDCTMIVIHIPSAKTHHSINCIRFDRIAGVRACRCRLRCVFNLKSGPCDKLRCSTAERSGGWSVGRIVCFERIFPVGHVQSCWGDNHHKMLVRISEIGTQKTFKIICCMCAHIR